MKKWTDEEVQILRDNYVFGEVHKIEELLPGRSYRSICSKAHKMNLQSRYCWTDKELVYLKDNYSKYPLSIIEQNLPLRNRKTISQRASELGLRSFENISFTTEDELFLREHYMEYTDYELGKILGRSYRSICDKRLDLNLKKCDGRSYERISQFIRANNNKWKSESAKQCNYQCVISGGRFDAIHHLYSFHLIYQETMSLIGIQDDFANLYNENELFDILQKFQEIQNKYPLGVCLKAKYHTEFHRLYGNRRNTTEQWNEYYSTHKQ